MNLGSLAQQVLAGGASCQAPAMFVVALILFTGASVSHLFVCLLLWQKPVRSRLDNLFLLLFMGMAAFYVNNLVAAFVCQQIEQPLTRVATALSVVQLCLVCTMIPLVRHVAYEKFVPGAAASGSWRLRNYLPATGYFLAALPVFWFHLEPWPATAGYVFTGFNIPGVLYFVPGSLRAYRVYRSQPDLVPERGWRQLVWASCLTFPALVTVAVTAPFVHGLQIAIAASLALKLILAVPSLVMIHSMLRYGFLDIVLKRSLLYAIVGVELLGLYLVLAFVVRQSPLGGVAGAVPALHIVRTLGFAAILAGAVKPLREQCERILDRTLFRHSTSFRRTLLEVGQALPRTADVATLVAAVAQGLAQRLLVSGVGVGLSIDGQWVAAGAGALNGPSQQDCGELLRHVAGKGPVDATELLDAELCRRLRVQGVDVIIPVVGAAGDGGVILLGRKPSGAVFLGEERAFLEVFAAQVASSVEHTRLLAEHLAMGRELARAEQLAIAGDLAARLAHEIRNPISAVKSLSQLVERHPNAPENAEHLRIVTQELDRVERRVAALLRLTRKEEYRLEPTAVGPLLQEVIEQFQGRLAETGVRLSRELSPNVIVRADAEKLRQVFANLIQNAIEAMAEVTDKHLTVVLGEANNGSAVVRICDSGPGVRVEDRAAIFEPFHTTKEHGTGLGLAIAKRIVDAHKGQLAVLPNADRGAVFTIRLAVVQHH